MNGIDIAFSFSSSFFLALALVLSLSSTEARADNPLDVEEYLREFHRDPERVMNDRLVKFSSATGVFEEPGDLRGVSFDARKEFRLELCKKARIDCERRDRAGFTEVDRVDRLVEGIPLVTRVSEMERRGLTRAQLLRAPWSDSYWPLKSGATAWRYADPKFPLSDFKSNYADFVKRPPSEMPMSSLSPAEKYDVLLGDADYTFTKANWKKGLDHFQKNGKVESWYGLCHGWAPASFELREARMPVVVRAQNGKTIRFEPSDIHALATALWADALGDDQYVLIGQVCAIPNPQKDEIGRVTDPKCFSTNPGSWHLTVVNRIGVDNRSVLMDATFDYEIWNQPVHSYSYTYFNPQTLAKSNALFGSVIAIEKFRSDKFKRYRSSQTKFVVGIAMDVAYAGEMVPAVGPRAPRTSLKTVRYVYDLELDANYEIVGGEWYTNRHPDFLWAPARDAEPVSAGEVALGVSGTWRVGEDISNEVRRAAKISSEKAQPVSVIVRGLIEASQQGGR